MLNRDRYCHSLVQRLNQKSNSTRQAIWPRLRTSGDECIVLGCLRPKDSYIISGKTTSLVISSFFLKYQNSADYGSTQQSIRLLTLAVCIYSFQTCMYVL